MSKERENDSLGIKQIRVYDPTFNTPVEKIVSELDKGRDYNLKSKIETIV